MRNDERTVYLQEQFLAVLRILVEHAKALMGRFRTGPNRVIETPF